MRLIKNIFIFALLISIFLMGFISASFEVGDVSHVIETSYGPESLVKGWINLSLNSEPVNSLFEDSLGNVISLNNLIKKNTHLIYSCTTTECEIDYSASNGGTNKSFVLNNGEQKAIGFSFNQNLVDINSINFIVQSDAPSSCTNQLEIDFFGDSDVEFGNNKISSETCPLSRSYGCFELGQNTNEYSIGYFPSKHCQRIELPESPAFKVGALINRLGDQRNLTMALYNLYGEEIENAHCYLPAGDGELSCEINYFITESAEYYICIYSNEASGESKIQGYQKSDGCGFYGINVQPEVAAFNIFAEGKKFEAVGTLEVSNAVSSGKFLGDIVKDYIETKYGNLDCSANDCVIPIVISSGENQDITLSGLEIMYETILGPTIETIFYDLGEIPAKITSDYQKIYLDEGNFVLPQDYGNITFQLNLEDEEIFSENIFIAKLPIIESLNPLLVVAAYPTQFEIIVESLIGNITEYQWVFGDNTTQKTTTNKVTHSYPSIGQYVLEITVVDMDQQTVSRTFKINVSSPSEMISTLLTSMNADLSSIKNQIAGLDAFTQKSLNLILDLDEIESQFKNIQSAYAGASSEEEYTQLLTKLLDLNIPKSIIRSRAINQIPFYSGRENIDLDVLQLIGGGEYEFGEEEKFIDSIVIFNLEDIETKVTFEELSVKSDSTEENILRVFKLYLDEKKELRGNPYFILRELEGLVFKENYLESEESGYVYIELTQPTNEIVFSTTEEVDFIDLPLFISPSLDRLVLESNISIVEDIKPKWKQFFLIIFILIMVGLGIYLGLQQWYKIRYENHLFKKRNQLYNLVTYIENSRRNGLNDKDVRVKLRKAGWSAEQADYVLKKYAGKRTGMWEIPIGKIFDFFKRKKVVQKPFGIKHPLGQRKFPLSTQKFNKP